MYNQYKRKKGGNMYTIDEQKTKKLGKILRKYRTKNNYTLKDIYDKTQIDPSTITRLENGTIYRINSLILTSLARLYNINPVNLLNIIGYIDDKDILEYSIEIQQINSPNNNLIEIIEAESILSETKDIKEFLNLPFLNSNSFKAYKENNFIFVYSNTQETKEEDLGIFSVKDQIIVAYFYYNETTVSLQNYFTNKNFLFLKTEITIIGRVEAIIDYNMYKK